MRPKIYIETSVVSYYTSRQSRDIVIAARQQVTREWWEEDLPQYDKYISVLVLQEASAGDPVSAKQRLEVLKGIPIIEITDEVENLAESLVKSGPIPENHTEDALHIALSIINGMDFLITWNFHHINNAKMKKDITKIANQMGYECPIICSPEELGGE